LAAKTVEFVEDFYNRRTPFTKEINLF